MHCFGNFWLLISSDINEKLILVCKLRCSPWMLGTWGQGDDLQLWLLASWGCLEMTGEDGIPPAIGFIVMGKFKCGRSGYSHIFFSLSKILFNFGCKSYCLCCKDRGEEFAVTLLDANPHACWMQI